MAARSPWTLTFALTAIACLVWTGAPLASEPDTIRVAAVPGDANGDPSETADAWLLTPPTTGALFDARFQPIGLIRTSLIYTMSESFTSVRGEVVDTTQMVPTAHGHRVGFSIDHVETGMKGRFDAYGLYYKIKVDLMPRDSKGAWSNNILKDAYFGWNRYRVFDVRLGLMKAPFSQLRLRSSSKRRLMESPLPKTLTIGRALGVQVSGGDPWGVFRLRGGLFNSTKKAFEHLVTFDQVLLVGRAEIRLHRAMTLAGVSVPDGFDFEFQIAGSAAFSPSNYDTKMERRWFGADLRLKIGRVLIEAEVVFRDHDRTPSAANGGKTSEHGWGWHVDLGVDIVPGVFDLTLRVAESDGDTVDRTFDPTFPASDIVLARKRWVTVGAGFHFLDGFRCGVEYTHRQEIEGVSLNNDIVLGICQYAL